MATRGFSERCTMPAMCPDLAAGRGLAADGRHMHWMQFAAAGDAAAAQHCERRGDSETREPAHTSPQHLRPWVRRSHGWHICSLAFNLQEWCEAPSSRRTLRPAAACCTAGQLWAQPTPVARNFAQQQACKTQWGGSRSSGNL